MKSHNKITYSFRFLLINLLFIAISCGGGSGSEEPIVDNNPANLEITVQLEGSDATNPNGNGSGKVLFNFSATNTTLYKINFGDGSDIVETPNKTVSHTYIGSGIQTFNVIVSAYNGSKFISLTKNFTVKIDSNLLWADEFNGTGVSSSNWTYEIGTGTNGWGNNEMQYYTNRPENTKVENGVLKIIAKKEIYQGSSYTSARLITKGKFDFKFGKVEVRAKLPATKGTWPAIWMLGSNFSTVGWPNSGEIDIMEQTGWNKNEVLGTFHWFNNGYAGYGLKTTLNNSTTEFHIYSLEWTFTSLKIFVDNIKFVEMNITDTMPFRQNFFCILNVAVGGNLGGDIDPSFTTSVMEIDYIRVYK